MELQRHRTLHTNGRLSSSVTFYWDKHNRFGLLHGLYQSFLHNGKPDGMVFYKHHIKIGLGMWRTPNDI